MSMQHLPFYANVEPEVLLILAAFLWIGAALVTGVPTPDVDSELPLLFAAVGLIAAAIGLTEFAPSPVGDLVTFVSVVVFVVLPVAIVAKILRRTSHTESKS